MRELKELPKGKTYSVWIPCTCGKGYESKHCGVVHKCPHCGRFWNVAPWLRK